MNFRIFDIVLLSVERNLKEVSHNSNMTRSSVSSPNLGQMDRLRRDASQVVRRTLSMILTESDSDILQLSPQNLGPLSPDLPEEVPFSPASGLSSPLALAWRSSSETPGPSRSWCWCTWCSWCEVNLTGSLASLDSSKDSLISLGDRSGYEADVSENDSD